MPYDYCSAASYSVPGVPRNLARLNCIEKFPRLRGEENAPKGTAPAAARLLAIILGARRRTGMTSNAITSSGAIASHDARCLVKTIQNEIPEELFELNIFVWCYFAVADAQPA